MLAKELRGGLAFRMVCIRTPCATALPTIYLHLSQRYLNATASPLDSLKLKDESPQGQ